MIAHASHNALVAPMRIPHHANHAMTPIAQNAHHPPAHYVHPVTYCILVNACQPVLLAHTNYPLHTNVGYVQLDVDNV